MSFSNIHPPVSMVIFPKEIKNKQDTTASHPVVLIVVVLPVPSDLPYNFIKISYRMKISGVQITEMNKDLIHLTGSLLSVSPLLLF
jgi:hypothetical protein